jgi:LCP family protein required for cell wall assembly
VNNFNRRKISLAPQRPKVSDKVKHNLLTALGILLVLVVIYYSGLRAVSYLSGTQLVGFFSEIFGKDLMIDDLGHTNILLMGVGGEGHEGRDLTDTMIIASIDQNKNTVSLLSIPRDLYIDSSIGGSRINKLYELGKAKWNSDEGLDFVKSTVENVFKMPIHYYAKVDFEAFKQIVDAIDGVDVYVEQEINDPEYPLDDGSYGVETFLLAKGSQHLDGTTALKYVRSRKTSSDFDRSKRQQQVLMAVKNKIKDEGLFSSKSTLKKLYYSLSDHLETNLSLREMLSLAEFGTKFREIQISMATLNDEPLFRGGFLYTPLRELYGGAFVLLPAGDNFDTLRLFANLVLYGPYDIALRPVAILNGTKESGFAGRASAILNRFGVNIEAVSNGRLENASTTFLYITTPEAEPAAQFIKKLIPNATISTQVPEEYKTNLKLADVQVILELGEDSISVIDNLDIFKNIFLMVPQIK